MIISTMNGEVKVVKITDHQKLKYVRNLLGNLKEYFWGSREHAIEFLRTGELNKGEFKGTS